MKVLLGTSILFYWGKSYKHNPNPQRGSKNILISFIPVFFNFFDFLVSLTILLHESILYVNYAYKVL